jgi:hypothetical protein
LFLHGFPVFFAQPFHAFFDLTLTPQRKTPKRVNSQDTTKQDDQLTLYARTLGNKIIG